MLDGPLLIPRKLLYQQTFFTPAPGMQDFSAGPEFTCTLNILPQGRYKAWVKAIDLNGAAGPSSAVQSFAWKTPVAPAAPRVLGSWDVIDHCSVRKEPDQETVHRLGFSVSAGGGTP